MINEWMKLVISLSLSASLIALALMALKPLYRNRLSKRWQYYIWVVVVLRLLLPFSPETNLMRYCFSAAQQPAAEMPYAPQPVSGPDLFPAGTPQSAAFSPQPPAPQPQQQKAPSTAAVQIIAEYLWVFWLGVSLLLLVQKITSYHSFLRFIKAGRTVETDDGVLAQLQQACKETGVSRPLPIYRNKLAVSPMLVGIFRPFIVLPELTVDEEQLRYILRHELTHYKKGDIFYKWLVQFSLCLHWFNPLLYWMRREINRNCELACDEAIISRLPGDRQRRYGDTLLETVRSGGSYGDPVASVTLSEDGKQLKERLSAIIHFGSGKRWGKPVAVAAALLIVCTAAYTGAYAGNRSRAAAAGYGAVSASSPPIILRQDAYTLLANASPGSTGTSTFQSNHSHTVFYIAQDGPANFQLTVTDSRGKKVASTTGAQIAGDSDPVLVFDTGTGAYSLELTCPADASAPVELFGAGLDRTGDYRSISLPGLPSLAALPEAIVNETVNQVLNGQWWNRANHWENYWNDEWENHWEQEAEKWEQYAQEWEQQWDTGENNWRRIEARYEKDYLVSVGVLLNSSPESYGTTVQIASGEQTYTVAFSEETKAYANNPDVLSLVETIVLEDLIGKNNGYRYRDGDFFVVRSAVWNSDPVALMQIAYETDDLVIFGCIVKHCSGDPIEELLLRALGDGQELYFYLLAEQLPKDFDISAITREIVDKRYIIALSGLERFMSADEYQKLMWELLDIDISSIRR